MEELERLVEEIKGLQTKLILLVGPAGSGKTRCLAELGRKLAVEPLLIGASLGKRLAPLTQRQRQLSVSPLLSELTAVHAMGDLLLLDNLELLFDATLSVSPLDILRQQAHSRRVVAVWPGELRDGRLRYAEMGHPEARDYSSAGLVTFNVHEQEKKAGYASSAISAIEYQVAPEPSTRSNRVTVRTEFEFSGRTVLRPQNGPQGWGRRIPGKANTGCKGVPLLGTPSTGFDE